MLFRSSDSKGKDDEIRFRTLHAATVSIIYDAAQKQKPTQARDLLGNLKRQMHQITYQTIVPLEYITSLTSSNEVSVGNPNVLEKIQPMENLYSQQDDSINPNKSFLDFSDGPSNFRRTQLLPDNTEIFRRTNIDHLNLDPNTPITNFQEIDKMYNDKMMDQRTNYEKQILQLNRHKDEQNKIAPIHKNYRVKGQGGPSFVSNYRGPRGQM